MFNVEETIKYLLKGTEEINDKELLIEKVSEVAKEGRTLRIKFGLDPSAPDIHLGHTVALRKLKQLQDLGHQIVIIIGNFTGTIGDPSGKSKTRNQLSHEQVAINAQTYLEQIFKILDKNKTELHYNSEWFSTLSFNELISLCSKVTVARMLERDDFNKRYNEHKPIAIHEFFYPLMQAYDSVKVKADIEFGGTDQTFNILMGRNIQKDYGMNQQVPLFVPLLVGSDGKEKMSKSLGNYIGICESAKDMYIKIMKIPDELIITYYKLATDEHPDKIDFIEKQLLASVNPRDIKMQLANDIILLYHTKQELLEAENYFIKVYQNKGTIEDLPVVYYHCETINNEESLIDCIFSTGNYKSRNDVRRLIIQGAVKINNIKYDKMTFSPENDMIIRVGKNVIFKLSVIKKELTNDKMDLVLKK